MLCSLSSICASHWHWFFCLTERVSTYKYLRVCAHVLQSEFRCIWQMMYKCNKERQHYTYGVNEEDIHWAVEIVPESFKRRLMRRKCHNSILCLLFRQWFHPFCIFLWRLKTPPSPLNLHSKSPCKTCVTIMSLAKLYCGSPLWYKYVCSW